MSRHGNEKVSGKYAGTVKRGANGEPVWTGLVRLAEAALREPLKQRTPMRIFANSMSDLFHDGFSDAQIAKVWAVMALAHWHDFQVLTKRAERMRDWLRNPLTPDLVAAEIVRLDPAASLPAWPLPNVWVGVSIENQAWADKRLPLLLESPAAIRFVSAEPLLEFVNLSVALRRHAGGAIKLASAGLDWVIVGGESGKRARAMHPAWARSLLEECLGAGIAYFFKQVGDWGWDARPGDGRLTQALLPNGQIVPVGTTGAQSMVKMGTEEAGDLLDGRKWQEFPSVPVPLGARKVPAKGRGRAPTAVAGVQLGLFGVRQATASVI